MLFKAVFYVISLCYYSVDLDNIKVKERFFIDRKQPFSREVSAPDLSILLLRLILIIISNVFTIVLSIMGIY